MLSCKCLNVRIELNNTEELTKYTTNCLNLSDVEKSDLFFTKGFDKVKKFSNITKVHPNLVDTRIVGTWVIHQCLVCNQNVYAIHCDHNAAFVLVNSNLLADEEIRIARADRKYSDAFNIVVNLQNSPRNTTNLDNTPSVPKCMHHIVDKLNEIQFDVIEKETELMTQRIRDYSNEQHRKLKKLKDRIVKEQHFILCNVLDNKNQRDEMLTHIKTTTTFDTFGNSLQTGNVPQDREPSNHHKDIKNVPQNMLSSNQSASHAEDIFEEDIINESYNFDRIDKSPSISSAEVSDIECEADSNEVGQPVINKKRTQGMLMARSLPINIPAFMKRNRESAAIDDDSDNEYTNENVDIAASIQALAKSVHGNTVFGELPRSRTRTQI